ncbi:MAG: SAM-dependent chlorinase/fluorinase [Acidimicrobiales bacterium]
MTDRSRPPLAFDTISFLTDYGLKDEFVGVVKSVIRSITPEVAVIDITHDIEPHDVRAGGLALARSVQYLAPGVVLAVVDPGVGTDRKGIVIEVANGAAYLVGPDNGLLAPAVSIVGGATGAVVLDNPEYQLPPVGSTFDGRDVFAPAAAHLCAGVPMDALGTRIDPSQLVPGVLPVSQTADDGAINAEVLWVDRFGNLQLNVDPSDVDGWGEAIEVAGGRVTRTAARVDTFADVPTGSLGLMVDAYGLLTIVVDRSSAAFELELSEGDAVTLREVEGSPSVTTSVQLGKTNVGRPTASFENEELQCDPPS